MVDRNSNIARRVLFLHSSAGRYGADLQLLVLASGLDRKRYNPLVVLPERGALAPVLEERGVEVAVTPLAVLRRADLGPAGAAGLVGAARSAGRSLLALARRSETALVHSNTSVILSGQRLARHAGVPHVVHVRELYPRPPLLWPLWRRRLLHADRLLCVSGPVAAQFGGSPRATVLHDALPRQPVVGEREEARRALGLDPQRFTVGVLGRISDWKGQDVLARALAEEPLAAIGAVGLVAGEPWPGAEGPLRRLERLRDQLGLGERLRLVGFHDDVGTLLAAVDAVAVPSTRPDPFPNAALDAAAAGVPVVAAAHGGLPEMLVDGSTGLLVGPGDAPALARALRGLADDPRRASELGASAAADVSARFAPERTLERLQAEYDALLARR